jgi:low temperature requirement protein LtrA
MRFSWRHPDGVARVSRVTTLELFFDLVFVFTLTQLTLVLEHDLSLAGVGRTFLLFVVLWWMYGAYAWLTNHVSPVRPSQRLLLLVGMAGFMVIAIAIPHAFGTSGVVFGLGYLVVTCVHLALFSQSDALIGVVRLAPFNVLSALLILGAGFVEGPAVYVLWVVAFLVQAVTPYLGVAPQFELNAEHFVERHGLLLIVALGETVVAIGNSVEVERVTAGVAGVVVLALALPAALWWAYFSGDDTAAEHTLAEADPAQRGVLAIRGYFFAHIPMLLGIVAAAAGIHEAVAHSAQPLGTSAALALAVGVALFFVGDAEFRRALRLGPAAPRMVTALLALATVPLGTRTTATVQLAALVIVIAGVLVAEHLRGSTRPVAQDV